MADTGFIPVNEPLLDGNEKRYLDECVDTGWISSVGPFVRRFEEMFAGYVGCRHAVAVTNGTTALEASVRALGIGEGDEVIIPSFTIISCAAAVVRNSAVPVVVDCDPVTWNMDVSKIEECVTERTKAIMAVHIYGLPVDMDPLLDVAKRHGLFVIEDCAQAIGLRYKGRMCGAMGDISTFSFYPNKHVTTGEGGMILMDDDSLAKRCESFRDLCFKPGERFVHDELGWNLRMTNMQAALGVAQLERLEEHLERKRRIGRIYQEALGGMEGLQLPPPRMDYAENLYWVFGVVLDDSMEMDAKGAMAALREKGVGTRPFFWPMHEQPVLRDMGFFEGESLLVSERIARRGFYLPSGLGTPLEQIAAAAEVVKELF